MTVDVKALLRDYKEGVGFKPNDVLVPKDGANPETFGVRENVVIVLRQDSLVPHEYSVVGERADPRTPADRFVKFRINGHNWQKR